MTDLFFFGMMSWREQSDTFMSSILADSQS